MRRFLRWTATMRKPMWSWRRSGSKRRRKPECRGLLLRVHHGRLRALITRRSAVVVLLALSCAGGLLAQRFRGRGGGGEGSLPEDTPIRTAREVPTHSTEFPRWTN